MKPIMRDRDSVLMALKRYESFVEEATLPVQIFRKYKNKECACNSCRRGRKIFIFG